MTYNVFSGTLNPTESIYGHYFYRATIIQSAVCAVVILFDRQSVGLSGTLMILVKTA